MRDANDRENLSGRGRRSIGEDAQGTHVKTAILSRQFVADDEAYRYPADKTDIAREEGSPIVGVLVIDVAAEIAAAKFKGGNILEEEIPRLGREEREPRRIDLPHVQWRIGKIGVDRQRIGQSGCDSVKSVAAGREAY